MFGGFVDVLSGEEDGPCLAVVESGNGQAGARGELAVWGAVLVECGGCQWRAVCPGVDDAVDLGLCRAEAFGGCQGVGAPAAAGCLGAICLLACGGVGAAPVGLGGAVGC